MYIKETLEETAGIVRLVLPLMVKHEIPITPVNYAVWYRYVSGKNTELVKTIDLMIDKSQAFSRELNEMFYQRFCVKEDENALHEIRKDLRQILLTVFNELARFSGQTEKFDSVISKSVEKLSEEIPIHNIRQVVDDIIVEAKTIGKTGKAMQSKLKETTKKLDLLQKEFENLKTEALVDFLTGISNRKAFDETLSKLAGESALSNVPLCLLLIDIDHFKKFNDEHGHIVGDEVLKFTAKKIKQAVRGSDFIARYGGEEFAVILPETPLPGAKTVAENIRASFAQRTLTRAKTSQQLGIITVSLGAARYRPGESMEAFIDRSDKALYLAKNTGRNRVAMETDIVRNEK